MAKNEEEVEVIFVRETEFFYIVQDEDEGPFIYLLKKVCKIEGDQKAGNIVKVIAPQWFLEEKRLV